MHDRCVDVRTSWWFLTLRVHVLCQFESVRIGQVSVGGSDSQDQTALPGDELHDHVPDLLLDVCGLVPHRHLGDARQVNESQVEHCNSGRRRTSEGDDRTDAGGEAACGRFHFDHMFFSADVGPFGTLKGEEIL